MSPRHRVARIFEQFAKLLWQDLRTSWRAVVIAGNRLAVLLTYPSELSFALAL